MKKWDDKIKPNFVPQHIKYRTVDGSTMNIILDKNTLAFTDWVAEIEVNGVRFHVDRDELVAILNRPTIKKEEAIYG